MAAKGLLEFLGSRRAGISEEVHDALTGHSNGSVGRSYWLGVPLRVLAESMAKVGYAGLNVRKEWGA